MAGLKPCPFCGGKAELCDWNGGSVSWVRCSECGADIEAKPNPYLAAKKWNIRSERTCKVVDIRRVYEGFYDFYVLLSCGHRYSTVYSDPFPHCPECGAKVVE